MPNTYVWNKTSLICKAIYPTISLDQPSHWTDHLTGPTISLDRPSHWTDHLTGPTISLDRPSHWTNHLTGPTISADQPFISKEKKRLDSQDYNDYGGQTNVGYLWGCNGSILNNSACYWWTRRHKVGYVSITRKESCHAKAVYFTTMSSMSVSAGSMCHFTQCTHREAQSLGLNSRLEAISSNSLWEREFCIPVRR